MQIESVSNSLAALTYQVHGIGTAASVHTSTFALTTAHAQELRRDLIELRTALAAINRDLSDVRNDVIDLRVRLNDLEYPLRDRVTAIEWDVQTIKVQARP